jgi:single-stranded-DNA-specific exonuclease
MEKATERIYAAIKNDERITIYADYDADGIPGATVLHNLLKKIGYENYDVYIPHRHDEGYGIHIEALEKIKDTGTKLIITVDVGITGHEAGDWCRENNIDLIITDHHLPTTDENGKEKLPHCYALVNPKQEACSYPEPMLCGCAVAFKIAEAFLEKYREEFNIHKGWEKWLLDLVGISTISDMVPLRNENRLLARYGMKVLAKTKRKGLRKLMYDAGLNINYLTEDDIAFSVSPKINAASRMSHPNDALAVFIASNDAEATETSKRLNTLNNERKKLVALTMKQAYKKIDMLPEQPAVIVVGSPHWQAGILGLVASKITEKYKCPAFVWSEENGYIKGSCRTWNGAHLVEIMQMAEEGSFIQFGGHKEAGGFSCEKSEIHFLPERLNKAFEEYSKRQTDLEEEPVLVDAEISLDKLTADFYQSTRRLAPFGIANPRPLFKFPSLMPESIGSFGKTKEHLEITFKNSFGKTIRGIQFFKLAEDFTHVPQIGQPIDVIAEIEYSVFRGKHELRLKIVDFVKN